MTLRTRPVLSNRQFIQPEDELLSLSGTTNFIGILQSKGIEIDGDSSLAQVGFTLTYNGVDKISLFDGVGFNDDKYVRYDVNNQGLDTTQRLNARTNIQAVSKDTNDERFGILEQNGNLDVISGDISISTNRRIDTIEAGGVLNIGTGLSNVINIGKAGTTVNIIGDVLYQNVTNLEVTDKLIRINKGGPVGSANNSGFEIEENDLLDLTGGTVTGYFKTNADRDGWDIKAPAMSTNLNLSFDLLSTGGSITQKFQNENGTIALVGVGLLDTRYVNTITAVAPISVSASTNVVQITHNTSGWVDKTTLTGANIISNLTVDATGHISDWTTRVITLTNLNDVTITAPTNGQAVIFNGTSWVNGGISGGTITGAELSRVNDTNVTMTLGGTPANSVLNAVSMTLGWSGQLAVGRGGTGASTLTGVVIGNGGSAMTAVVGIANQLLRRNSGNTAYEFFTHDFINQAGARTSVSLTTTGNSGAATYNNGTGVFNIPNYTLAGLGGDNYGNWNLQASGGATIAINSNDSVDFVGTSPINVARTTRTITYSHANSGVTAGTYNNVTVNVTGHVTGGSNIAYLTAVNLGYTESGTQGTVTNTGGSNAIIPAADPTRAGLVTTTTQTITGRKTFTDKTTITAFTTASSDHDLVIERTGANNATFLNGSNLLLRNSTLNTQSVLEHNGGHLRILHNIGAGYSISAVIRSDAKILINTQNEIAGGGNLQVVGTGNFTGSVTASNFITTSDRRIKRKIKPIENALEVIDKFISYEYEKDNIKEAGFMAQEIREVLPYTVFENDSGILTMSDRPILAYLHSALIELKREMELIKKKL